MTAAEYIPTQRPAGLSGLLHVLDDISTIAVAVSGGVDSMTLATLAHRAPGVSAEIFHAVSPAVPPEATRRVRRYAEFEGWTLRILDADEFGDPDYLRNPVDRCYFCKKNLYSAIAPLTTSTIVSGTNTDDLGEYRPGLGAARDFRVRHPYVEAGFDKSGIRTLAADLGLDDIADLPAAPCLSSRIETGIPIAAETLAFVNRVETTLEERLSPRSVRCRVRAEGLVVELDQPTLDRLSESEAADVSAIVSNIWAAANGERRQIPPVRLAPYRTGSAFLVADISIR